MTSRALYPADAYYGHNVVLAWYCGLVSPPPFFGQLQHGWNPTTGFGATRMLPGIPKLMWSERNARVLSDTLAPWDARSIHIIGAPFLYLAALLGEVAEINEGTLVYPFHQGDLPKLFGRQEELIEVVRERETDPVTVCLYFKEYDEPAIREAYAAAGFRVTSHGHRTDPLFLVRQWLEISRHRRVVSNRVSTAIWYGGWLGREIEVYGPVWSDISASEGTNFANHQRRLWPDLVAGGVSSDRAKSLAGLELGSDHLRNPDELARLLGWCGRRRIAAEVTGAALGLIRRRPRRERSPTSAGVRPSRRRQSKRTRPWAT